MSGAGVATGTARDRARRRAVIATTLLLLVTSLTATASTAAAEPESVRESRAAATSFPKLRVTPMVGGLRHPWDVQRIPEGWLITERTAKRLLLHADGTTRRVAIPRKSIWSSAETGLMSIAVDPSYAENRRIYVCHGGFGKKKRDVRVVRWTLDKRVTRVTKRKVLLSGIQSTGGFHGGCRLLIADDGSLLVGTGDAWVGRNPQDLTSLNGKVLRLDRRTGDPWPENPWAKAGNRNKRYLLTYGHRNVQGLAQRGDGTLWSAEHGPDRDDEVNRLIGGGNYGWNPVTPEAPDEYDQSVPMTDHSLPGDQIDAAWSSGSPTIATSGAAWVKGKKWGRYRGTLAVAALAGERVVFMKFDGSGGLKWTKTPATLRRIGRLRSVTVAPNNDLLITTADGSRDRVLRVRPAR